MAVEYIDNGNDDGTNFGKSTSKIGFYGLAAPIVKQTLAAAVTTASDANGLLAGILQIQVALKNLGLITTV
jgi:hypothetical protein